MELPSRPIGLVDGFSPKVRWSDVAGQRVRVGLGVCEAGHETDFVRGTYFLDVAHGRKFKVPEMH